MSYLLKRVEDDELELGWMAREKFAISFPAREGRDRYLKSGWEAAGCIAAWHRGWTRSTLPPCPSRLGDPKRVVKKGSEKKYGA
jgi:hypothetical protein